MTRRQRVLQQRSAKRAGQKWDVTYRTPSGRTFTRLFPAHYGRTPAEVRPKVSNPHAKRSVGQGAGMSVAESERLRVVSVKRSDRF